jgi:ACS family hexuronate transporter-like MFS transporter
LVVAFGSLGLFPVFYSLNQELSGRHQGKVGGSLGFCTWFTLSYFHDTVGGLIKSDPNWRTVIFCVVGIAPLLAYAALKYGWGTRDEAS